MPAPAVGCLLTSKFSSSKTVSSKEPLSSTTGSWQPAHQHVQAINHFPRQRLRWDLGQRINLDEGGTGQADHDTGDEEHDAQTHGDAIRAVPRSDQVADAEIQKRHNEEDAYDNMDEK